MSGLDKRLALVVVVAVLAVGFLARELVSIGTVQADELIEGGRDRRTRSVDLLEPRGTIMDREGTALAMSRSTRLIAVDPTLVKDTDQMATRLSEELRLDRVEVLDALEKPDTQYSVIARQVEVERAERLGRLDIDGLIIEEDSLRVLTNPGAARSVIGSMDRLQTEAISGIEKLFDDELRQQNGRMLVERGAGGETIPGSERIVEPPRRGSDVQLTVDSSVNFVAGDALLAQVDEVDAAGGAVVVGNPKTGKVLGMASVTRNADGEAVFGSLNQAVRAYEPGSVMKLVTVAAAYDAGVVTSGTRLSVPPKITLWDQEFEDAHDHPEQMMTVDEILSLSSNVGTIKIAQQFEKARSRSDLVDYFEAFGFGSYTALGLHKEQAGFIKQPEDWNGSDIGAMAIGQTLTATPVQIWAAYNAIANGGIYTPPVLVERIVDADGTVTEPPRSPKRRVVSEQAAEMLNRSLRNVIEEGTGQDFKIPGFNIAAKTGTAYKVQDGTYGNDSNRIYASSFVGFFPATDPEISIMVMIDEPARGKHFGATAAGPVFDQVAREAMRQFDIPTDIAAKEPSGATPARSSSARSADDDAG